MTTQREYTADCEQALADATECLEDIETLAWKFPIGAIIDYGRENGLPLAVIAHLEDMQSMAAKLVGDAPEVIRDFVEAALGDDSDAIRDFFDEKQRWDDEEREATRRFIAEMKQEE